MTTDGVCWHSQQKTDLLLSIFSAPKYGISYAFHSTKSWESPPGFFHPHAATRQVTRTKCHCAWTPTSTGGHSKEDPILLVKIAKHIGFGVYRRSYLPWSPVIVKPESGHNLVEADIPTLCP